jgi:hypothetical protein
VFVITALWMGQTNLTIALAVGGLMVALALGYGVWGGPLARAVFPAVGAALLPLLLPSLAFRLADAWGLPNGPGLCLAACLFSGAAAAGFIGWVVRDVRQKRQAIIAASGLLAAVGGTMSCLRLGMMGVSPYLVGLALVLAPLLVARGRRVG